MMFPLKEMDAEVMAGYVVQKFKITGCKISRADAGYLIEQAEKHPYHTQRIAHAVWNSIITGRKIADESEINNAIKRIIGENSDYYRSLCALLTTHQFSAMKVAAHINGEKIFSRDFLAMHGWQKDSLKQAFDALVDKELLSREENSYKIDDIFFRRWILDF